MMRLKTLLVLLTLCTLLAALPAAAQEATATAEVAATETTTEGNSADGLSALVLMMGIGAVLVVGGVMFMREGGRSAGKTE
ncbi:MAG: hypothetical protein JNJ61_02395 [Anaerolineae bacterium]|nr:hypothetical protein [Anaerolineae bacterium]